MPECNVGLIQLRKHKNMSQDRLSQLTGFTRQYISRVENGESEGKREFWLAVQQVFNIPDDQMWKLYKGEPID